MDSCLIDSKVDQYTNRSTYANDLFVDEYLGSKPYSASPYNAILVTVVYLWLIVYFLPWFMSSRKPYTFTRFIAIYNISQIMYNAILFYLYIKMINWKFLKIWENTCHPIAAANNFDPAVNIKIAEYGYYYYLNKVYDFTDTLLFSLKKKTTQVTFLHVYHHAIMVPIMWFTVFALREEIFVTMTAMNTLIHSIMYIYYFLSNLGPTWHKYLWWKKYITIFQIMQFFAVLFLFAKLNYESCKSNPYFTIIWTFVVASFLILFVHFYVNAYKKTNVTVQQKTN